MNAFDKSESIKASLRQGFQDGSSKMAKRNATDTLLAQMASWG